jgi:hypothetical protein
LRTRGTCVGLVPQRLTRSGSTADVPFEQDTTVEQGRKWACSYMVGVDEIVDVASTTGLDTIGQIRMLSSVVENAANMRSRTSPCGLITVAEFKPHLLLSCIHLFISSIIRLSPSKI